MLLVTDHKMRIVIVRSPYYHDICDMLTESTLTAARQYVEHGTAVVYDVAGALEIPQVAAKIAKDAASEERDVGLSTVIVALGCIIRGQTYHFEVVSDVSAASLSQIAISSGVPIGNAILTVENHDQALARAPHKGGDALRAALLVWRVNHHQNPESPSTHQW